MGRKRLFFLVFLIPILLSYNNCSKSSGDLSGTITSSSSSGGDLGFQGKRSFDYFSPSPNCSSDWAGPVENLELNGDTVSGLVNWNRCNDQGQAGVVFDRVLRKSYNPFMAFFNDKIYVAPELHEGVDDYLFYREYCHNDVLQMDFTIQYLLIDLPGLPDPLQDWVAVTMYGPNSASPGLQFNGGFLDIAPDGSKYFGADNGAFEIEISEVFQPGRKIAVITKANGTKIPMDCWFDPQNE